MASWRDGDTTARDGKTSQRGVSALVEGTNVPLGISVRAHLYLCDELKTVLLGAQTTEAALEPLDADLESVAHEVFHTAAERVSTDRSGEESVTAAVDTDGPARVSINRTKNQFREKDMV